ncbi:hypothetical protein OE766_03485 [Pararhizobium sp. YC-54]|uniref:hypothetical protein n=1 Tax=Pararhizobium sp. YC-54 TaxID=2986920 RepID=UPI0021F6A62D|nr:hypothetical protein [Pararhizobium sp. YC-54]MCV9997300.1 hypothetical protein [Pararhizobium sp. YC-54]
MDYVSTHLPFWPAALNHKMAAAYCGVSVETFKKVCPVKPMQFTGSSRGERYLRQRIDEWLLSIDPNSDHRPTMAELMYGKRRFGSRLDETAHERAPTRRRGKKSGQGFASE